MTKRYDVNRLILECETRCRSQFEVAECIALANQKKVLDAFRGNKIALRHFSGSTGYAYGDSGRELLSRVFAGSFAAEDAIVSPLFGSGTHTISTALFGLLRPNDTVLSISGRPYNTLTKVIDGGAGSLKEFGVSWINISLKDGEFDFAAIESEIKKNKPALVYIQRAKGYEFRRAFSVRKIKEAVLFVRKFTSAPVAVDNCYGEFVETQEPLRSIPLLNTSGEFDDNAEHNKSIAGIDGANIIMGSLIKNPGGGFAPAGGYIAGDKALIKKIEGRYSAPGVGFDIGANPYGYQYYFQGLFMAPHIVLQAVKAALLFGEAFSTLGYEVLGRATEGLSGKQSKGDTKEATDNVPADITTAIKFNSSDQLVKFCRAVQYASPIDSYVTPYPSAMPGYNTEVIMASGSFVQGSSVELSADAPLKEPYIAYMQGSLTYEHARIALGEILEGFVK